MQAVVYIHFNCAYLRFHLSSFKYLDVLDENIKIFQKFPPFTMDAVSSWTRPLFCSGQLFGNVPKDCLVFPGGLLETKWHCPAFVGIVINCVNAF